MRATACVTDQLKKRPSPAPVARDGGDRFTRGCHMKWFGPSSLLTSWMEWLLIHSWREEWESGSWMEVLVVSGGVRNRWQKSICYLLLPVHRSAPSLRCHTNYQHTLLLGSSRHGMQIAKSTLSFPFLRRFHHRHTSGQKRTARVPCFKATANHEHSSSEMAIGFRGRTSGRMDC